MNEGRGGLLTAGGVLAIIVGAFEVIGGGMLLALSVLGYMPPRMWLCPIPPSSGGAFFMYSVPMWLIIMGGVCVVLGIVAIAGGVSAVRRKSFGLALAGAICALPSGVLGILALIFVSLGKGEFEAEY
ncbi:MAG: hypothetical protein R6V59_04505 [Dehalococcoidia bacterium]